jgi:hypothetical protein
MLSVVAGLTPYSDFNQSPRNMYQCQMAKQTMGTPGQALLHRTDTKMYRLQTPQAGPVNSVLPVAYVARRSAALSLGSANVIVACPSHQQASLPPVELSISLPWLPPATLRAVAHSPFPARAARPHRPACQNVTLLVS